MKKFIKQMAIVMAILMIALFTTNCKKDSSNPSDGTKTDTTGVFFNINPITQNGSYKSTLDVPPCSQLQATKVDITLQGGIYTTPTTISLDVFYIGVIPYTKSLKLDAGHYTIKEFLVYNVNNNVTTLLSATPHLDSQYANFLSDPILKSVDMGFDVIAFKKTEMKMEVVCYTIENYSNFGFTYYQMDEIIVRKQYFFGDLCIKDLADYANTPYTEQGLRYDLIAIFKVKVKRTTGGGVVQNWEYSSGNWPSNGNNTPLEVSYGDFKNSNDHFVFELWVLVRQGTGTGYKLFQTWEFDNQSNITEGIDNVVDFVIGNCVQSNSDYHFEPYMNLPPQCGFVVQLDPHNISYFDVTLSNFTPSGNYDIPLGLNQGYCGDLNNYITLGHLYTMNVYSSLYLNEIPDGLIAKGLRWDHINWLINNLDQFIPYNWQDLQAAIWRQNNGWTGSANNGVTYTTKADDMWNAMKNKDGYSPLPGGWACVIFVDQQGGNSTQLQFIKIYP